MTTTASLSGACPECDTEIKTPAVLLGETLSCPECMLTLRVDSRTDETVVFETVEVELRDWGQ